MVERENSVERLEVHLIGLHTVYYKEGEHEKVKKTGKKICEAHCTLFSNQKYKDAKKAFSELLHLGQSKKDLETNSKIQVWK